MQDGDDDVAYGSRGWWMAGLLAAVALVLIAAARPAVSAAPRQVQLGLASWYGPGFHGEETASGEIFDQREMVAAHRTLPAWVGGTGDQSRERPRVVLRVIDRGPYGRNYRKGTIIDVSRGAARRLEFIRDGLVRVRVEVVRLGGRSGPIKYRHERRARADIAALDALGIAYELYDHPPVFTGDEAAITGSRSRPAVKNLFLRNKKGDRHYLVILASRSRPTCGSSSS